MMSERRRGRAAWAVAALIALVLAACSSGDAPGASATATDVSPPAADVVATTDADAPVADMPELPAALAATGLADPTMWVPGPNGEGASFVAPGYRASATDPEAVAWEYLDTFTDVYGVGAPGERFEVLAVTPTAVGTIVRFDQRLGDLPLYAGGFTLTVHDSTVTAVTGMVLADAEVPAAVLDADAILAAVGGSEPGRTPDPDTLRAVAYSPLLEGVPSDAVPAWELEFDGEDWTDRERVVLSAIDGSRLAAEPLVIGAESWDIYQSSGTKFDASTATHVISVRGDEITQEDNTSTDATLADANMRLTWDYFADTHSRDAYDGEGGNCELYVHAAAVSGIAGLLGGGGCRVVFGTVGGFDTSATIDVVAHEYTHAVIRYTAGLKYQLESGALNEHYADFFAVMIDDGDWEITAGQQVLRDISDVRVMGDLVTSADPPSKDNDYGGVHTNSSIPNHAAFLVADQIGRDKAAQVWYPTLLSLNPTTTFAPWACATIATADALAGEGMLTDADVMVVVDAMRAIDLVEGMPRPNLDDELPRCAIPGVAGRTDGGDDSTGGDTDTDEADDGDDRSPDTTDPDSTTTTTTTPDDDGAIAACFVGDWELDSQHFLDQIVTLAGSDFPPGAGMAHVGGRYVVSAHPDGTTTDRREEWRWEMTSPDAMIWVILDGVETGTWRIDHGADPTRGSLNVQTTGGDVTVRFESPLGPLPFNEHTFPTEAIGTDATYVCSPTTLEITSTTDGHTITNRFTRIGDGTGGE